MPPEQLPYTSGTTGEGMDLDEVTAENVPAGDMMNESRRRETEEITSDDEERNSLSSFSFDFCGTLQLVETLRKAVTRRA